MTDDIKKEFDIENVEELELDLDSVDLDDALEDDELDSLDLSNFGEVDDSIDKPHIKVSTKDLKEYLKVAKEIASSSGRDVVSKSVCLKAEGDKLVGRATDFDVYLEYEMDLLNHKDVLTDTLTIPIEILQKLIKAVPVNTIIFKDEDEYKMRLAGGDIPLETYNIDESKYIFSEKVTKEATIAATDLYEVIKNFGSIVTAAVAPTERRIICESDAAYANYMFAIIRSDASFAPMDLKVKDINVMRSLVKDTEEVLTVYSTDEDTKVKMKVIEGPNFKYAFLISDISVPDQLKQNMSNVVLNDGVYVDFIQFYKMIEVAAELPYSIGKVGLNYSDNGELRVVIKTKSSSTPDSVFDLPGSVAGNVTPLEKDLVLQAKLLRILLRSFADSSSIKISLADEGMGIYTDTFVAAVYSEGEV